MNLYSGKKDLRNFKPVITIWGEAKGKLQQNNFDFSFGDSSFTRFTGYTMLTSGRILKMGLSGGVDNEPVSVFVCVNGQNKGKITKEIITKENAMTNRFHSAVTAFNPPIELQEGEVVSFKTADELPRARSTVVSLLVEIDC